MKPETSEAGVVFAAAGSRLITVNSVSNIPMAYQASASDSWLAVNPARGTAMSGAPGESAITVNPAGLLPGVYRGGVSYAFDSDAVRTVNVTLVVPGSPCDASQVVATQVGLADNFQAAVGMPVPLTMEVVNGCGTPVAFTQVTAAFSNGDAPVALSAVDGIPGRFAGTWVPQVVGAQVAVVAGSAVVSGKVTPY